MESQNMPAKAGTKAACCSSSLSYSACSGLGAWGCEQVQKRLEYAKSKFMQNRNRRGRYVKKEKIKLLCPACKNYFEVLPSRSYRETCSKPCAAKIMFKRGTLKPGTGWKKGVPKSEATKEKLRMATLRNPSRYWLGKQRPELRKVLSTQHSEWRHQIKFRTEYRNWRWEVIRRDGYKCATCGVIQKKLHVHHIVPVHEDMSKVYAVENGIVLCRQCHDRAHSKRQLTPELTGNNK